MLQQSPHRWPITNGPEEETMKVCRWFAAAAALGIALACAGGGTSTDAQGEPVAGTDPATPAPVPVEPSGRGKKARGGRGGGGACAEGELSCTPAGDVQACRNGVWVLDYDCSPNEPCEADGFGGAHCVG
jgi:hypothetical protein